MKRYQIALVGGQKLPIYLGALEQRPDVLYLLHSDDSKEGAELLQSCLPVPEVNLRSVDAYEWSDIQTTCDDILSSSQGDCEWALNTTGGTKIMSLAATSVFLKEGLPVFYIDQSYYLLGIGNGTKSKIESTLSVTDFFRLAGQSFSGGHFSDFSEAELDLARHILERKGKGYASLVRTYQKKWPKSDMVPSTGRLNVAGGYYATWDIPNLLFELCLDDKKPIKVYSNRALKISLEGGWWEILVAEAIAPWTAVKELVMNAVLPFKNDGNPKNEIDILINLGHQMIFIDCKSGYIKMDDINKVRVMKDTYGGLGAKAAIVCRWKPEDRAMERCREARIAIYSFEGEGHSLEGLIPFLTDLAGARSL
jgi:hypothetical protein